MTAIRISQTSSTRKKTSFLDAYRAEFKFINKQQAASKVRMIKLLLSYMELAQKLAENQVFDKSAEKSADFSVGL